MQPEQNPTESQWSFQAEEAEISQNTSATPPQIEAVSWTGSEFIAQHKTASWYAGLFAFIGIVCVIVLLISRDVLSVVFIAVMGILFAVIANHKPRQRQYIIDEHGLSIGQRHYTFSEFKSFSLQRDGAIGYISLLPLQRIRPELSIYYVPEDEDRIFNVLSNYLPHEDHKESVIDKLAKSVRF